MLWGKTKLLRVVFGDAFFLCKTAKIDEMQLFNNGLLKK